MVLLLCGLQLTWDGLAPGPSSRQPGEGGHWGRREERGARVGAPAPRCPLSLTVSQWQALDRAPPCLCAPGRAGTSEALIRWTPRGSQDRGLGTGSRPSFGQVNARFPDFPAPAWLQPGAAICPQTPPPQVLEGCPPPQCPFSQGTVGGRGGGVPVSPGWETFSRKHPRVLTHSHGAWISPSEA